MKFLSEDAQFARSMLEKLIIILARIWEEFIKIITSAKCVHWSEADIERVSRVMDPVFSEPVLMDLITFNEEIL